MYRHMVFTVVSNWARSAWRLVFIPMPYFNREDERLVEQLVLQISKLKGQLIASTVHDAAT